GGASNRWEGKKMTLEPFLGPAPRLRKQIAKKETSSPAEARHGDRFFSQIGLATDAGVVTRHERHRRRQGALSDRDSTHVHSAWKRGEQHPRVGDGSIEIATGDGLHRVRGIVEVLFRYRDPGFFERTLH